MPIASRLVAIDHVEIESGLGIEGRLRWFYGRVAGLSEVAKSSPQTNELRFKSERIELRISMVGNPRIESTACRVSIEVPSLLVVAEVLDECRHSFVWYRGLCYTDRYLSLLDPAGNRVELRRRWLMAFF
jgi:hypothetical protein